MVCKGEPRVLALGSFSCITCLPSFMVQCTHELYSLIQLLLIKICQKSKECPYPVHSFNITCYCTNKKSRLRYPEKRKANLGLVKAVYIS